MFWKFTLICLLGLCTLYYPTKAEDEIKIEVVEKPNAEKCERTTKDGDLLSIHYTGRLAKNGKVFDSSRTRNQPFEFTLGKGMVIQGYEQGLKDMCVGESRKLTIPPHLGYGEKGAGETIPGGATLEFDVELLDIKEEGPEEKTNAQVNVFKQIDKDNNEELSREEVLGFMREQGNMPNDDASNHETIVSEIFQQEDTDKDGVISYKEFTGPKHEEL